MSTPVKKASALECVALVAKYVEDINNGVNKGDKGKLGMMYTTMIDNVYSFHLEEPKKMDIMRSEVEKLKKAKALKEYLLLIGQPNTEIEMTGPGKWKLTKIKDKGKKGEKIKTVDQPTPARSYYYNRYMIDDSYDDNDDDMYSQQSLSSYGTPSYNHHDHYVDSHYYGQEYGYQPKYLYDNNSQNYSLAMIIPAILIGLCLLSIIACICCIIGGGIGYGVTKLSNNNNNKGKGKDYYQRVPRDKDYEQEV